ncbi:MAG: hypothetical protein JO208_14165 [Alphaproteobacteria bacterium]|nr:hypothetical protein [Alphaproteobacteria bacterium]
MPFEIPSSAANGLLGEVYRDLKAVAKESFKGLTRPMRERAERRALLSQFHPDFANEEPALTDLVSYSEWHETDKDWREGKGLWCAATHGEMAAIWTNADRFPSYEARLLQYRRFGGETRRLFVIGPEIYRDAARFALFRTLRRHHALGFQPRVCAKINLQELAHRLDELKADTVACFNSHISYFIRCRVDADPLMVRSIDIRRASRIEG